MPDVDLMSLVSYAESRTYMHDVLLRDTDQMSMRHGLEVRVPLLDHELVEYVMRLPRSVKHRGARPAEAAAPREPGASVARRLHRPAEARIRAAVRAVDAGRTAKVLCETHLGADGLAGAGDVSSRRRSTLSGGRS